MIVGTFPLAAALAVLGLTHPDVAHADGDREGSPRFSRHIVALFSKLGCNGGTCHGAVKGQNGFRLALFGADPALDHARLVHEFGGRRPNRHRPDANHPRIRQKIADDKGCIARILKEVPDDARRIDEVYLWTLCRPPTAAERRACLDYVQHAPSPAAGLRGVMRSLLNTREFLLQH